MTAVTGAAEWRTGHQIPAVRGSRERRAVAQADFSKSVLPAPFATARIWGVLPLTPVVVEATLSASGRPARLLAAWSSSLFINEGISLIVGCHTLSCLHPPELIMSAVLSAASEVRVGWCVLGELEEVTGKEGGWSSPRQ